MRNANGRQENALDDVLGGRLQAMLMESHRRREERVAELRALGREPASREDEVRAINATVDFTLRRSGPDLVEVRLGFRRGAERVLAWGAD